MLCEVFSNPKDSVIKSKVQHQSSVFLLIFIDFKLSWGCGQPSVGRRNNILFFLFVVILLPCQILLSYFYPGVPAPSLLHSWIILQSGHIFLDYLLLYLFLVLYRRQEFADIVQISIPGWCFQIYFHLFPLFLFKMQPTRARL